MYLSVIWVNLCYFILLVDPRAILSVVLIDLLVIVRFEVQFVCLG